MGLCRVLAMPAACAHAAHRDLRLRRLSDQGARWFGVGKKVVSSSVRAGSEARTTDNRTTIALGKLSLWANWLRDAAIYWSELLMLLSPEGWYTLCRGRRPR